MMRFVKIALAAIALLAIERTADAAGPTVEVLADGTRLVVAPLPGTRATSFRYLVYAGGASDPVGMEGLAHILEHAVFHGNAQTPGQRLFQATRERGAYLNAFTGPDHTVYVVDGPSTAVWPFLPTYLGAITNPAFDPVRLDPEHGVINAEALLRQGQGSYQLMVQLLLPGLRGQMNVIGTERSRARVRREELLAFYGSQYVPGNTTIIVTGDVDPAKVKELIESSSLLAPGDPGATPVQPLSLNIPTEARVPAPFYATLFGFDLGGEDRATCRALAELVDLRLTRAAALDRPLAASLAVACLVIQGRQLLVSMVSSRSYEGAELPDLVEAVFAEAKKKPLTAAEREHVAARDRAHIEGLRQDPAALADALVFELSARGAKGDHRAAVNAVLEPLRLDADAMRKAAEHTFVADRRIKIDVAPF